MIPELFQSRLNSNPINPTIAVIVGALLVFLIARFIVARGLIYLTTRTKNQWDDILIKHMRPYRLAGSLHSLSSINSVIYGPNPKTLSAQGVYS